MAPEPLMPRETRQSANPISAADEARLIQRARQGDATAVAGLVRAHQAGLYAFVLRMSGSREVAEDIVQDSFVRVLRHLDRFDSRFRFSTWVYTIARRLFINQMQRRRPVASDAAAAARAVGEDAARSTARTETMRNLRSVIDDALAMLSPVQREIVLLFHQQGWAIAEIATHLAMPEGTIKSHLFRARRRMHETIVANRRSAERAAEVWS